MRIRTTTITDVTYDFEMFCGSCFIVYIKTETDSTPVSFRCHREFSISEWQLMHILHFANVTKTSKLIGKTIKEVVDNDNNVVGYGIGDTFFLFRDEEENLYGERTILDAISPKILIEDY